MIFSFSLLAEENKIADKVPALQAKLEITIPLFT